MKNSFFILLFLFIISSCAEKKTEETKPAIDPEIQQELDDTEKAWTQLTADFAQWQKDFMSDKESWIGKRPLDSMKTAAEKNSTYSEILGDGWKKLYEEAVIFPEKVDEWNDANLKTIQSFNMEASNFSEWKNKAESGDLDDQEMTKMIGTQKSKIEEGRNFFEDMKKRWETMKFHDSEMIQSFRALF